MATNRKKDAKQSHNKHQFESLSEFDRAMKHIVTVPKETVDEKQKQAAKKKK